ncbi:UPF0160 protein [Tetranychus urticae]|uniref:Uncharacterized protein n=1 Tax=Tetranychus urticae TaxID=32264 RepID=T1KBX8_TETUR|nr:UPF0160 protein [Tetranychus urticae]
MFFGKFAKSVNFHLLSKMQQSTLVKKICTHNGVFHCDDVLACFLLKQLPEYKDSPIIRTRDPKVIEECDIVVDVGGVYDHSKCRYDHHQRDFNFTLNKLDPQKPFDIKLSSAGLVYYHYGRTIINNILEQQGLFDSEDKYQTDILFDTIYESFIQEIDAIDNGVSICEGKPRYTINSDLSTRVGHLRPHWNEESTNEVLYERFQKAMDLVGQEFHERVSYYSKVWYPAKKYVKQAVRDRKTVHPSGTIIDLSLNGGLPWKEHLFAVEKEMDIVGEIKFAIFQDLSKDWRVCCVPIFAKSFTLRTPLHIEWRGLRDEKLSQVSDIPDCIFVHATGFIGGARTREACVAMAVKTLDLAAKEESKE